MHKIAIRNMRDRGGITIHVDGKELTHVIEAEVKLRANNSIELVVRQHDTSVPQTSWEWRELTTCYPVEELTIITDQENQP